MPDEVRLTPKAFLAHLMDKEGSSFLKRLWDGGAVCYGAVFITDRRVVFVKITGLKQRLAGGPKIESIAELDAAIISQGGFSIQTSDILGMEITERYNGKPISYSDLKIRHSGTDSPRTFRFIGYEVADETVRLLKPSLVLPKERQNAFGKIEQFKVKLEQAWIEHGKELADLPTPKMRGEILLKWKEYIDSQAHDYADLVLSHPEREKIMEAEIGTIIRAHICGYMANRGWIEVIEASQAAFMLGRDLRDQLREMQVPIDGLKATLGTVIDRALGEIVKIGIEKGARR